MGLLPSERASKIIRVNLRKLSFDELGPEISWVKGGPGNQTGGWGHRQSGGPLSPGGECFAPLLKARGIIPADGSRAYRDQRGRDHAFVWRRLWAQSILTGVTWGRR